MAGVKSMKSNSLFYHVTHFVKLLYILELI